MDKEIIDIKRVWLIMSKCRTLIAKGTPRDRSLVRTDDKTNKKRFLTYSSKGRAEAGFRGSFFYTYGLDQNDKKIATRENLEAVEVEMIMREI